jgi:hypothetical protein
MSVHWKNNPIAVFPFEAGQRNTIMEQMRTISRIRRGESVRNANVRTITKPMSQWDPTVRDEFAGTY